MGSLLLSVAMILSANPAIHGTFKQTKFVKEMNVTLNSSGEFSLDKSNGLAWKQTEPFEYTFKVNKDRIELVSKGSKPEIITKESQPLMFGFSQTFLSMFSGDMTTLKEKFEAKESGTKEKWKFDFIPRDEMARKAIKGIQVAGGKVIDLIRVEDAQGNAMSVTFQIAKAKK